MATYMDVAKQALVEYTETILGNDDYTSTPVQIAAGAWEAMLDALEQAGADTGAITDYLMVKADEPAFPLYDEPWGVDPDLGQKPDVVEFEREMEDRFGEMADRISAEIVGALREAAKVLRKGESL